jgi:hypothetical protein
MMPPPLPGYAAAAGAGGYPMPAPAAAPQGYPGPAVAAPAAAPVAPAPQQPYPAYAVAPATAPAQAPYPQQPQQAYPAPAPAQAPPQGYAYNPQAPVGGGVGDIGAAIAAATGGDRAPRFQQGTYDLEFLETIVTRNPVTQMLTFKARFKVLASNNPAIREGEERAYIEGLAYGAGRVQDCVLAGAGWPAKAEFDKAYAAAGRDPAVELVLLGNACGNPTNPQNGNHYPPNPLAGRRVRTVVSEYNKIAGPQSKKAGQTVHIVNHVWSPLAAA